MNERPQPREENMERAAKVVILADERSAAAAVGAITSEGEQGGQHSRTFYQQKLCMAERGQSIREQNSGPPTVIAIPEKEGQETENILDDLDSVSASIPFGIARLIQDNETMSAEVLDKRFQQITEMLVDLQRQRFESLSNQYTVDNKGDTAFVSDGVDPPGSHAADAHSSDRSDDELKPPSQAARPDPPAMQVLIDDMLAKVDPTGSVQLNDLSDLVYERLYPPAKLPSQPTKKTPPEQLQRTMPFKNVFRMDTPDLDSKMPGRSVGGDVLVPDFEEEWENAERRIESLYEALWAREGSVNQRGAFRVTNPAVCGGTPTPPDDTGEMQEQKSFSRPPTPTDDTGEMQEQKSVSPVEASVSPVEASVSPVEASVSPVEAHVVPEDQVWMLEKLDEVITSLQQQTEARIVHASQVITEDNDNNDPSFCEMYGITILMVCLAFGVGIFVGSRT